MSLDVRLAKAEDVSNISEMVNAAYRGESGLSGWTTEAKLLSGIRTDPDRVLAQIAPPNQVMLIAETQNPAALEGCVHLERKDERTAYLGMLTTNATRQAKGTGSLLLASAEKFAEEVWRCSEIEMTVISLRVELIEWYVKRGYKLTNEKRPFPSDPRFGIPLVEGLEFAVLKKTLSSESASLNH
jgi:GNAT superfamily N-acetyltransferase